MSGLRKIILHHSYYNGLRVAIPCHGHTYLLGTNGAGKTSALNLIPIFYGKDPASLVERAADKQGFVDYYLPNHQSLIVFEYARVAGEICCAVIYRQYNDQYAYRFIAGAADDTLFHPELEPLYERGVSAGDILKRELPKRDVDVSPQLLNIIDYRSVIQNDPGSSGKRRRARSARFAYSREARKFSLGDGRGRMQHLEALTAVALNKGHLLSSLKAMIVDTMLHDNIALTVPEAHHKNKDLWSNLSSLQEFDRDKSKLQRGLDAHGALQETRGALLAHRSALDALIHKSGERIREQEDKAQEMDGQIEELAERHQVQRNEFGRQEADYGGTVKSLDAWLNALEDERVEWEARDVASMKQAAELRPDTENRFALAKGELRTMTGKVAELEESFGKQQKEIEHTFRTEERRLMERDKELNAEMAALVERSGQQDREFDRQCAAELEAMHRVAQEQAQQLADEVGRLQSELGEAGQPRAEEQAEIDASEEAVETAEHEVRRRDASKTEAHDAHRAAITADDNALQALAKAEGQRGRARDRVEDLTRQLYPKDGTLLAFLRSSELPWHDTLGKLAPASLLHRTDLSPQLARDAAMDQAYGLLLDLSALPRPEAAEREEVLEAQLEKAEKALQVAQEDVGRQEDACKLSQKARKEAEGASRKADHLYGQAVSRLDEARASHRMQKNALAAVLDERREAIRERIRQAQTRLREHEERAQRAREARQQHHEEQRQQRHADLELERQRIEEAQGAVRLGYERAESHRRTALKDNERIRDQAMGKEGVDPDAIAATRERIEVLGRELESIRRNESTIRDYDAWYKDRWGMKSKQEAALGEAQRRLTEVSREKADAEERFSLERSRLNEVKRQARDTASQLRVEVQQWEQLSGRAEGLSQDIPEPPGESADDRNAVTVSENPGQLTTELLRLVNAGDDQKGEVLRAARTCTHLLGQHPGSMIYRDWQNLREERRAVSRYEEGTPASTIELMQDLEILLEHRLPHIQQALIENVHSVGAVLSDYHGDLRNLNSLVDQVSRKLDRGLNTQHTFSVISDVSIRVVSKIHTLDFWRSLEGFSKSWREWATTGFHQLPPNVLLKQITDLEDRLRHARMETYSLESMVDLEIVFYEQSRRVPIRKDADLERSGSTGISRLAILVLFSALTRYLCPDEDVNITWPIDELGELAPENIVKLFEMMHERNIALFCAEPKLSHELQGQFESRVALSNKEGVRTMTPAKVALNNPLLARLGEGVSVAPATIEGGAS